MLCCNSNERSSDVATLVAQRPPVFLPLTSTLTRPSPSVMKYSLAHTPFWPQPLRIRVALPFPRSGNVAMWLAKKQPPSRRVGQLFASKVQLERGEVSSVVLSSLICKQSERLFSASRLTRRAEATAEPDYASMTLSQLREELRSRKMKMSGTKLEMLRRLGVALPVPLFSEEEVKPRGDRPKLRIIIADKPGFFFLLSIYSFLQRTKTNSLNSSTPASQLWHKQ